jgi:hypothetical protein
MAYVQNSTIYLYFIEQADWKKTFQPFPIFSSNLLLTSQKKRNAKQCKQFILVINFSG